MNHLIEMYRIHLLFIAGLLDCAPMGVRGDTPTQFGTMRNPERIVGGKLIDIVQVPFLLSFRLEGIHVCGGVIVSRNWGVTAAHCATAYDADPLREITIRSGTSYTDRGGLVHNITRLDWHEKFDSEYSDYDIAVFEVAPSFEFSYTTKPIRLPSRCCFVDVSWALAAGWGELHEYESTTSRVLQYVILPKVSRAECANDYAGRYAVTPRQVCYGFRQGGHDTCKGDSGGPLVNRNKILIGITSWGDGCAKPRSPGVYTDVILLADWVRAKITTA